MQRIIHLVSSDNFEFTKHASGALCCIAHSFPEDVVRAVDPPTAVSPSPERMLTLPPPRLSGTLLQRDADGILPLVKACTKHKQALRALQALSASVEVKGAQSKAYT